jgi:hypothetical protein
LAAALQQRLHAPLRAYLLVRALLPDGHCHGRRDAIAARLVALGVPKSTAYDWLAALVRSPLARATVSTHGDAVLVCASYAELGHLLGVAHSAADVALPLAGLIGRTYRRALALAATALHPRPIARATKTRLYGVSPNTQRRAERDAGARVVANYRRYDLATQPDPAALPDRSRGGVWADATALYEQLPNTTEVPAVAARVVRRRRHLATIGGAKATAAPQRPPRRYWEQAADARRRRAPWCGAREAADRAGGGEVLAREAAEARLPGGRRGTVWGAAR